MTRFLRWRKMTWAILLGSVVMIGWMIGGGAVVLISALWSVGIVVLTIVWFMSRPLWRQGHGARIQPPLSPEARGPRASRICPPSTRADARIRTADPFITSEVLYQLSYVGGVARV